MEKTYLIQRLVKPREGLAGRATDVFAFGGGYANGGLSPDAMALLKPIFQFDYMGAAEFEFGAVPNSLTAIAKYCNAKDCAVGKYQFEDKKKNINATFFYLCKKELEGYAKVLIPYLAQEPYHKEKTKQDKALLDFIIGSSVWWAEHYKEHPKNFHLNFKESPFVYESLTLPFQKDTIGWLELDNDFIFFRDAGAYDSFCKLMGVDATEVIKMSETPKETQTIGKRGKTRPVEERLAEARAVVARLEKEKIDAESKRAERMRGQTVSVIPSTAQEAPQTDRGE